MCAAWRRRCCRNITGPAGDIAMSYHRGRRGDIAVISSSLNASLVPLQPANGSAEPRSRHRARRDCARCASRRHALPVWPRPQRTLAERAERRTAPCAFFLTSHIWTSIDVNVDVNRRPRLLRRWLYQSARNSAAANTMVLPLWTSDGRPPHADRDTVAHAAYYEAAAQIRAAKSRPRSRPRSLPHTIRLEPKVEQARTVAEILGIDLNFAIAVCVSVHHHRPDETGAMKRADTWELEWRCGSN